MDGLEATRRIRALEEQEGRPRTPIITLVADPGQGSRQSCLDAGMDEYVTKPIQRKRMLELVSAWVDPRPVALIVDGSVDTRAIVRRYIERDRRIRPVCVGDGEAALRLVHRRPFDVVVVSKEMPRMDGLELLREILALDPGARCILLTRDSDTETRRRAKEAGALGFVTKPVEHPFFIETLLEVLGMPFSPKES
jgi:CheY-like chemotaxis protein